MKDQRLSPYLLDEPPTSTGKALLARAFEHWCVLHHGYVGEDIAAAFDSGSAVAPEVRTRIAFAARLLGELIAAGRIRAFVRTFGGGSPVPMAASDWELDDFRPRFASSAVNAVSPFADGPEPTHWIFVDLEDFNRIVERSCADVFTAPLNRARAASPPAQEDAARMPALFDDRHVRMPELQRRTGMSRSTIHRRIAAGRFPEKIPMDGNISAWWESEIAGWLASPR